MTKKPSDGNGWRAGRDPIQRWLRIVASVVCLIVFAWLALDPSRRDWPTLTIALGALLVLLGYEAIVRLPYLGRSDNPSTPPSPDYYQQQQYQQQQYPYTPPTGGEDRPDNIIVSGSEPEVNN
jgi:hypothetical protein